MSPAHALLTKHSEASTEPHERQTARTDYSSMHESSDMYRHRRSQGACEHKGLFLTELALTLHFWHVVAPLQYADDPARAVYQSS